MFRLVSDPGPLFVSSDPKLFGLSSVDYVSARGFLSPYPGDGFGIFTMGLCFDNKVPYITSPL